MTDLSALIAHVEEGSNGDRQLDGDIVRLLSGSKDHWFTFGGRFMTEATAPALTSSLDSVLSLIEQKLPGWAWGVSTEPGIHGKTWHASVSQDGFSVKLKRPVHFNAEYIPGGPARALLAATLRALSALEDSQADLADATNGDRP